nr:hypothetical protein TetV2_00347 [Oceanusvirus sp.]
MRKKIYTVGTGAVSAILKTMNPDKILGIEGATVENICIEYDNNQDNICTKDCIARGGKNESCVVFSIAACVIVTAAATIAGARV